MATQLSIPCNGTLLPTRADLVNIFNQLVNLAVNPNIPEHIRKQIQDILDNVDTILGAFPISVPRPLFNGLRIPEIEWERRIAALLQEYHLYVQTKILELINSILDISFEIEIPGLGITVDILRLWSDPTYVAELKQQVCENIDTLFPLIPESFQTYAGEYGIDSIELRCDVTWSYIMSQLNSGALGILHAALGGLIDKFEEIWDALQLPSLPALLTLDIKQIILDLIKQKKQELVNAVGEKRDKILQDIQDLLDTLSIGPFDLLSIIGGEIQEFIVMAERKIDRKIEALRDFAETWPQYLIKKWMERVTEFLEAIGLGDLLQWLTFDFCDFLTLIGFPTSITLPALPDGSELPFNVPEISNPLDNDSINQIVEDYINPPEEEESGG